MKKQKKQTDPKSIRVYRVLRWILIPLVLLIMIVSAAQLVRIVLEYREGESAYQSVAEQYVTVAYHPEQAPASLPPQTGDPASQGETPEDPLSPVSPETPETYAPIIVDFDRLREMNGECIGWIFIPDTNINYPVMQTTNNSKYLTVLPDGTKNKAGSIFMDTRNNADLSDCNTVIYGHRLRDGSMFSPLNKYKEQAFFDAHRIGYFLTPDRNYTLTAFACMTVSAIGEAYEMYVTPESLQTYLAQALKDAKLTDAIDVGTVERIVTLSTCTGNFGTRTVLLCTLTPLG